MADQSTEFQTLARKIMSGGSPDWDRVADAQAIINLERERDAYRSALSEAVNRLKGARMPGGKVRAKFVDLERVLDAPRQAPRAWETRR